ncbi:allatostatins [Hetaerina americana]|uniref:allatostatins n=1 Tax=Hetaerina americana TaxID=62018 RepID=UPI003A7F2DBC
MAGILPLGGLAVTTASLVSWALVLFLLPGTTSGLAPADSAAPVSSGPSSGTGLSEDDSTLDFYKRLYDFGLGKRAYSYVSEYKRLPVYNFGLGKRADRMYSFGLGKRDKSLGRTYSFGIGKRDWEDDEDDMTGEEADENGVGADDGSWEEGEVEWGPEETKRARQMYSFGLGKRARQMYGFGLGKRARTYSFGVGKRYPRYGFGLGKRADEEEEDVEEGEGGAEVAKRRDHRFSFGLGKREVSGQEEEGKRGGYYDFGIGKRAGDGGRVRSSGQGSSFGRAGRRTYSFGLGKRLPMYDFGLGKRSEAPVATETNVAAEGESSGKH